jgi:hypothetical protein
MEVETPFLPNDSNDSIPNDSIPQRIQEYQVTRTQQLEYELGDSTICALDVVFTRHRDPETIVFTFFVVYNPMSIPRDKEHYLRFGNADDPDPNHLTRSNGREKLSNASRQFLLQKASQVAENLGFPESYLKVLEKRTENLIGKNLVKAM